MTLPRSCAICGKIGGSLCPEHRAAVDRRRAARKFPRPKLSRQARGYDAEYDRARKLMIADAWEKQLPCIRCGAGFQRIQDITADHIVPLVAGGKGGPLGPAHAACNSRAGARGPRRRR